MFHYLFILNGTTRGAYLVLDSHRTQHSRGFIYISRINDLGMKWEKSTVRGCEFLLAGSLLVKAVKSFLVGAPWCHLEHCISHPYLWSKVDGREAETGELSSDLWRFFFFFHSLKTSDLASSDVLEGSFAEAFKLLFLVHTFSKPLQPVPFCIQGD